MQANIFKRFYWWEKECVNKIEDYFGTNIVYKSWKEINQKAETISDDVAERVWQEKRCLQKEWTDYLLSGQLNCIWQFEMK
ncbi:MAG: hypothetical protein ACLSD7_01090 [Coprococcus phoceensis]